MEEGKKMYVLKLKRKKSYFKGLYTLRIFGYSQTELTHTKDQTKARCFSEKRTAKNFKKNHNMKKYKVKKRKETKNE